MNDLSFYLLLAAVAAILGICLWVILTRKASPTTKLKSTSHLHNYVYADGRVVNPQFYAARTCTNCERLDRYYGKEKGWVTVRGSQICPQNRNRFVSPDTL